MEVLYIFLGAVLTFFATSGVELWKDKRDVRQKEKSILLFLRLEFKEVRKSLDALKAKHEANNFYDYNLLADLTKDVESIESVRREAVVLSNSNVQEQYLKLVTDLSRFARSMSNTQRIYDRERELLLGSATGSAPNAGIFSTISDLEKFDARLRTEILVENIELKRRIDEFLKSNSEN